MIVLAQHRETYEPETVGAYSIKRYSSEKLDTEDGSWRHERIVLHPLNPEYSDIEMKDGDQVVAAFLKIISRVHA